MTLLDASRLVLVLIAAGLVMAGVRYLTRWCSTAAERRRQRRTPEPMPHGLPIEQLAVDLRRLLRLHGELAASAHNGLRTHRVWAIETAIGMCAIEAAIALEVPHPQPDRAPTLTRAELSILLSALAAAGLVLPSRVGGFTLDGRA
ncbi:hypothetical protein [Actinoplanes derwentensis]|uniref:Uncharacterized protein n=1 Tax=Actinoplanes derwentensis TaxID=113562 RepID=A0A1H1QJM7_9ACTN|nr:hypothetical protein [Actinoplanes derwentensis]GID82123.1 hypothetical protein Ade03nite_10470 [Actinoplanes derwentensis]SDS23537.1 hypothetical protein SAMN04489716_0322 [Actinoplanes derwentensis]